MSDAPTIPPLVVEFEVGVGVEHAFTTWVERTDLWWPTGHTMSGAPAAIVFEPRVGGRIFERDENGTELEWGEVTAWAPPLRVEFLWHLFFTRAEATHVSITFAPSGNGTAVQLVQTGWESLGEQGEMRRERTVGGWAIVTAQYRTLIERQATS